MRFLTLLGPMALLFASSALAAPAPSEFDELTHGSKSVLDKRIGDSPPNRQPKIPSIGGGGRDGEVGAKLANGIRAVIDEIMRRIAQDKNMENIWVGKAVDELLAKNPTKNVLIFHDQSSKTDLKGAAHSHYELTLNVGFGKTKGYEIFLFDSGIFELHGDGGYLNVGYGGCFNNKPRGNAHVEFAPRTKKCPW